MLIPHRANVAMAHRMHDELPVFRGFIDEQTVRVPRPVKNHGRRQTRSLSRLPELFLDSREVTCLAALSRENPAFLPPRPPQGMKSRSRRVMNVIPSSHTENS